MISINNLTVEFSAKTLFDNINYVINPKDKIALVGKTAQVSLPCLKSLPDCKTPHQGQLQFRQMLQSATYRNK